MRIIYYLRYSEPCATDPRYTEPFGLGYFDSAEKARAAIEELYKRLPGFRDGKEENYHLLPFIVDEGLPSEAAAHEGEDFYVLSHGYDIDHLYTIGTVIGVYSSREKAETVQRKLERWPIFALHNRPEIGGEFTIDPCFLNRRKCEEGFCRDGEDLYMPMWLVESGRKHPPTKTEGGKKKKHKKKKGKHKK